jgi:hypothetical protein
LEILPSGLYLVRLQSKQLNYFTKLIKKWNNFYRLS